MIRLIFVAVATVELYVPVSINMMASRCLGIVMKRQDISSQTLDYNLQYLPTYSRNKFSHNNFSPSTKFSSLDYRFHPSLSSSLSSQYHRQNEVHLCHRSLPGPVDLNRFHHRRDDSSSAGTRPGSANQSGSLHAPYSLAVFMEGGRLPETPRQGHGRGQRRGLWRFPRHA